MSHLRVTKLISELPAGVLTKLGCDTNKETDVTAFVKSKLLENRHDDITKDMGKRFVLGKMKNVRKNKKLERKRKTPLDSNEKHKLGFDKLPKTGLKYKDVERIHTLWNQYMNGHLQLQFLKKSGFTGDPKDKQWENISNKLVKSDLHGAYVTVIRSTAPSLVGIEGIIVLETKNVFQVIGTDNIIRTIPKKQCEFSMLIDCYKFSFFGRDLCSRSSERSVKKNKTPMFNTL